MSVNVYSRESLFDDEKKQRTSKADEKKVYTKENFAQLPFAPEQKCPEVQWLWLCFWYGALLPTDRLFLYHFPCVCVRLLFFKSLEMVECEKVAAFELKNLSLFAIKITLQLSINDFRPYFIRFDAVLRQTFCLQWFWKFHSRLGPKKNIFAELILFVSFVSHVRASLKAFLSMRKRLRKRKRNK